MKKTLVGLLLTAVFIISMYTAIFAVDDVGPYIVDKNQKHVKTMVDDVGPY